jgi:hypothetical protein
MLEKILNYMLMILLIKCYYLSNQKKLLNEQELLCRDFPSFLKKCIGLYDNIENTLELTMTNLKTTAKVSQSKAIQDTVLRYTNKMNKYINLKDSKNLNIEVYHTDCKRDAIKYFNKLYIMGNEEERKSTYNKMIQEILNKYNKLSNNIQYNKLFNINKCFITALLLVVYILVNYLFS